MKKCNQILIIFYFLSCLGFCQEIHFNAISVKDGLSQHDVSSIIQDSDGFIWIATYDGLNRFDGYRIKNFYHRNEDKQSLSSNRIQCLFEDNKKRIWTGTDGYGLNYYSIKTGIITRVEVPDNFKIINSITQNTKGEIIVATTQGILKVTEKKDKFLVEILQSPLTGFNIKEVQTLNDSEIIFATNNGIWRKTNKNGYTQIDGSQEISFNTISGNTDSTLWVAGSSGLYKFNNDKLKKIKNFQYGEILSITEGINNDLWIATSSDGLIHFDIKTNSFNKIDNSYDEIQYSFSNTPLKNIYKDKTNTLWVSNKFGLLYSNLDDKKFKAFDLKDNKLVKTLFATNDYVYFGFQGDQFYKYNLEKKSTEPINLPDNSKPFRVDTLNGKIHLATTNGLYQAKDLKSNKFERLPIFENKKQDQELFVTSFCKDDFGNEFIGTFRGLILKNKTTTAYIDKKYKNLESLRDVRVFTLLFDHFNNCIWAGTISDGLFKINIDKNGSIQSMERYNEQMVGDYNIPNNSIWCFFQEEDGSLYLGTDTGLLYKANNKEKFKSILDKNIQNKKIMGIVMDDSANLWLSNSRGIIKYNPKNKKSKKYNSFDGLLTNTFTEAVSRNNKGELFFGNILGINYFKSGSLQNNLFPSKIIFTRLIVNNKTVDVNEELSGSILLKNTLNNIDALKINYKQNDFTIQFSSTNFANHKVNKYRYKLENYDSDWIVVNNKNRFASYSNIPDGDYKLWVEATNPNGQWSGYKRNILINIKPAPWNTWWAYTLYVLIIILIISVMLYFWLKKEKLRNQIEVSKLKSQQQKEINELKLIFFTDIAHEFKTPLSLIIGPIEDLVRGNISKEHRKFCYKILSRNTNRMLNLINQLLDFRKINSGVNILRVSRKDICAELRGIVQYFEWEQNNSNINLKIITPDSYYCHFDKDILEKVIFNLLSNSFKYTPFGGSIEIELKPIWKNDLEYIIILLKDSGKGIPQNEKRKIFDRHFHGKDRSSSGIGLHLSASLVNAHKGEINVSNSSLGGTEFMITLPVSSTAFSVDEFLSEEDMNPITTKNYIPGEAPKTGDILKDDDKDKVLIVEDDHDLRRYLKNILICDYNVYEAANGKEGIDICLKEIPDIVITDIMMPELDGIELCKLIKKNILVSHVPVLMLTAKTGDKFSKAGLQVGAWDYIAKPFNSYQLILKVKNILKTRNDFRQQIIDGKTEKMDNNYVSYDKKIVQNIKEIIINKITEPDFSVEFLAKEIGLSRMQLHRKLNSLIGLSTTAFINKVRIEKAIKLFENGCDRVQEAMDEVGISSYSHFNLLFKKEKGMTPSKYIESQQQKINKNTNEVN